MWNPVNLIYVIFLLVTSGMGIYGYVGDNSTIMWVGIVLLGIGLLPILEGLLNF